MTDRITVVGMGFVGLTTAAVFAEKGCTVYGVDANVDKVRMISKLKLPFFEPGLDILVKKAVRSRRLLPTNSLNDAIRASNIVFVCVGTPMRSDGSVNLEYIRQVSSSLGVALKNANNKPTICVKSTVPPGTTENIVQKHVEETSTKKVGKDFGIAMTPEFLREGSAVTDSMSPHLIVIGSNDNRSRNVVCKFFRQIYGAKAKILNTNIVSAELIKYANNSFLATKISFINTIANVCNRIPGADVDIIAKAIGTDPRIGSQFLNAGPGYGGSCFPKDVAGFIHYCQSLGYDPLLLEATDAVNKKQVNLILDIIHSHLHVLTKKRIAILGTAFKKDTDDIRESVSIRLMEELIGHGADVRAHDPMALPNTRERLGGKIMYASSVAEAARNAEAIILMTDWDEYKTLNEKRISRLTKKCLIIDTRRILQLKPKKCIEYVALGRS